jgi:hypothetical protein
MQAKIGQKLKIFDGSRIFTQKKKGQECKDVT